MYKCPKCDTEFSLGTKFCKSCGCNLEVEFIETPTCPICGKTFPTGTKFCSEHGAILASPEQLIPRCSKCGKQYTDGTKFCPDCGGNVHIILKNQSLSANDFMQTMTDVTSTFTESLRSKSSMSVGVLAGTVGVILLTLFNWIKITIGWGYSIKGSLFSIVSKLNHRDLRSLLDSSAEFTLIRIVSVLLILAMLLSFTMLIISLFMKPQIKAKPTLAYSGFGLCAIVTAIFIVAMMYISIRVEQWILTVFPFLTLAVAIVTMIFAVKRPSKNDFRNAANDLGLKSVLGESIAVNQQFTQITHLPNATSVLILGIVSIASCWLLNGIIGIITGIIGLVMGNKAMMLYKQSPGNYSESSFKNMKAGRICSIIGLCMSILFFIFGIGTAMFMLNQFR